MAPHMSASGVERTWLLHRKCPLLTQSGHQPSYSGSGEYPDFALTLAWYASRDNLTGMEKPRQLGAAALIGHSRHVPPEVVKARILSVMSGWQPIAALKYKSLWENRSRRAAALAQVSSPGKGLRRSGHIIAAACRGGLPGPDLRDLMDGMS